MAKDNTTAPQGKVSPPYSVGDLIVFKYEGNLRATVTGCLTIEGNQWLEARCQSMELFVPCSLIAGIESREEG